MLETLDSLMTLYPLTNEQTICYEIITKDLNHMVESISSKKDVISFYSRQSWRW